MPTIHVTTDGISPILHRPLPERMIAGEAQQTIWNAFVDQTGQFSAGVWECTPGTWRVVYPENEFCHILSGRIVIRGDDGSVADYRTGDSFVVGAGFTGTWEVIGVTRKLYAIFESNQPA
jgi:uncharacterized cupin superfamily protein